MCEMDRLNQYKKEVKKEERNYQLETAIKLISKLGEPAMKFRIIDEMPMTHEMIEEFELEEYELAIKTGIPGRPPKGKVVKNPTFGDKYQQLWRYDLRSDVSGPKILPDGRTRPFCTDLIEKNRYYSREDISKLKNGFGISPFKFCGGYWTQPDGSVSKQCRHNWVMIFVERK